MGFPTIFFVFYLSEPKHLIIPSVRVSVYLSGFNFPGSFNSSFLVGFGFILIIGLFNFILLLDL